MKKRLFFVTLFVFCIVLIVVFLILNYNRKPNIKYVFLFIGDGMSSAQVELSEIYEESVLKNKELLIFSNFTSIGFRKNKSGSSYVTDSAASATVLASGSLTYNGSINTAINGDKLNPITYLLHENGMKIGIVTNVAINHATPAAFYGYASNRNEYNTLAYNLANSDFEFFAGGDFILNDISDDTIIQTLVNNGYTVINSKSDFENLNSCLKCVVLDSYSNFSLDSKNTFSLEDYVKKGIELMGDDSGFFMMIESGMIDVAMHNNDAKSAIYEVKELDKAVKVALDFASKHESETLIIVTGDHETGGLSLGNNSLDYQLNLDVLGKQKYSYQQLLNYSYSIYYGKILYDEVLNYLSSNYGINSTFDLDRIHDAYLSVLNGKYDSLYKEVLLQINNKSGISFSTNNHTGNLVPVYSYGVSSDVFNGVYDSEEFNRRLRMVLGLKFKD